MLEEQSERLLEILNGATRIAFLTGAGVSTNSGIPDFQTIDEDWTFPVPRHQATSIEFFQRNPKVFWEAYRYLFDLKTSVRPNSFHRAVAGLEAKGKEVVVLTQNVDGLHRAAGSSMVGELHGNVVEAYCSRSSCPERVAMASIRDQEVPRCSRCKKILRPDVVLFGETPRNFGDAKQVCLEAEVLIVAGTSLEVGPVNDLPRYREWYSPELPTVWMNRYLSPPGYRFSHFLNADLSVAAEVLNEVKGTQDSEPSLPPLS